MISNVVRKNSPEIGVDAPLPSLTPAPGSSRCPMMAPSAAPKALLVINKPINAPKTMPFHAIRVDLYALSRHNRRPSMVAVRRPHTHGTVLAVGNAFRVAATLPQKDPSRKGT